MNQTAPGFQVSALSKAFRGRRALDVPVLSVGAGEKVALIGASGSGMSTLLRHMAGLMLGGAGEVQVHDRVVQSRGRLSRSGCGPGWAWCSSSSTWSAACRC